MCKEFIDIKQIQRQSIELISNKSIKLSDIPRKQIQAALTVNNDLFTTSSEMSFI